MKRIEVVVSSINIVSDNCGENPHKNDESIELTIKIGEETAHGIESYLAGEKEELQRQLSGKEREKLLTSREEEIMEFVTEGLLNKEIADKLGIRESTVKNHLQSVFRKLNVMNRTEAAGRYRSYRNL